MNFASAERLRGLALGGLHWWHCDGLVDDCPGVTATMLRCFEAVRQGVKEREFLQESKCGVLTNLLRKLLKIPSFELISDIQQKVQLPTPCVLGFWRLYHINVSISSKMGSLKLFLEALQRFKRNWGTKFRLVCLPNRSSLSDRPAPNLPFPGHCCDRYHLGIVGTGDSLLWSHGFLWTFYGCSMWRSLPRIWVLRFR